jgi:hypothetical protein
VAVKILGTLLVVLGIVALVLGGITYTDRDKVLDIGPLEATVEEQETIPLSPVLGVTLLAGGIVLLVFGSRARA